MDLRIVFITAPNIEVANEIGSVLLKARLVACVNIIPSIQSFYWWNGNIESSEEVQIICKTGAECIERVFSEVKKIHPYEVPEIVAIKSDKVESRYLKWVNESIL